MRFVVKTPSRMQGQCVCPSWAVWAAVSGEIQKFPWRLARPDLRAPKVRTGMFHVCWMIRKRDDYVKSARIWEPRKFVRGCFMSAEWLGSVMTTLIRRYIFFPLLDCQEAPSLRSGAIAQPCIVDWTLSNKMDLWKLEIEAITSWIRFSLL